MVVVSPIEVLVVEDNPVDVRLAVLLLEEIGLEHHLHVAENADTALQYLAHEGPYENAPIPHLVLVDLNLPKLSGFPVLEQLKDMRRRGDPIIAVAVWSGFSDEAHKQASQVLGADDYFVKAAPGTVEYEELIGRFRSFWERMNSGTDTALTSSV